MGESRGMYWHIYSRWSRLLHHFNLHRTRTIGPLEPTGDYVTRCDWCGLSGTTFADVELVMTKAAIMREEAVDD